MADLGEVLDDVDDATARLILELQLEDIAAVDSAQSGYRRLTKKQHDNQFARQIYELELEDYRRERGLDQPAEPASKPEPVECCACGDFYDQDQSYQAPCGHEYCTDCLSELFSTATKDERLYPPRCCNRHMPFAVARQYLTRDTEVEFESKREELDDTNRTYCHVPTCSRYIPQQYRYGGVLARCTACPVYTCIQCNGRYHTGDCPVDQGLQEVLEAGRQEGWQQCKACNRMIELTIGCNHITCVCRAEFCYVCGADWKTCPCPHFTEARLYERAREVARRQRRNVAEVAERLRERHECAPGEHQYRFIPGAFTCDGCNVNHTQFIFRCRRCQVDMCCRCRRHY